VKIINSRLYKVLNQFSMQIYYYICLNIELKFLKKLGRRRSLFRQVNIKAGCVLIRTLLANYCVRTSWQLVMCLFLTYLTYCHGDAAARADSLNTSLLLLTRSWAIFEADKIFLPISRQSSFMLSSHRFFVRAWCLRPWTLA